MAFPTDIPTFNDPTSSDTLDSPDHAQLHQDVNTNLEAAMTKVGTGATTPSSGAVLVGDGAGTSAWDTSPANLTFDTPTLNTPDANGTEVILDADADTSITADTDDQIDVKIGGADDFRFLANIFRALAGSSIEADTINETTSANGVTIDGLNIKDSEITTANSLPDGAVVQVVATNSSAVATGTTQMVLDDTIPQNTEGDEYMTLAITPLSATNKLVIEVTALLANSSAARVMIGAIFQDTTTDALAAGCHFQDTAAARLTLKFTHSMTAGTTSSTTFKFRAGAHSTGTTTFNGSGGTRLFGAITKSSIVITEYKAS